MAAKNTYLCLIYIFLLGTAQAQVNKRIDLSKNKKDKEPALELDSSQIEENLSKKPQFTSSSSDQKMIDEVIEKNQEKNDEQVFAHIEKIEECGKRETIEEIKKCRIESLKKNKK